MSFLLQSVLNIQFILFIVTSAVRLILYHILFYSLNVCFLTVTEPVWYLLSNRQTSVCILDKFFTFEDFRRANRDLFRTFNF
jgi:Zn-dependent membrane protease YugP